MLCDVLGRRLKTPAFWLLLLLFLAGLGYAAYWHLTAQVIPFDDAFITFRYVKNLFLGQGLTYNPGERVFGSSTPLYVLWLAALRLAVPGGDLPALAVRGNLVFYVASAVAFACLARRLTGSWLPALVLGTLFAINPAMLDISLGGMESFLFVALVLGTLWCVAGSHLKGGALLAGLAVLARPEGLLVAGIWGLHWLMAGRRGGGHLVGQPGGKVSHRWDWLALACLVLTSLPWLIFATLYYGTPIPHSLIAKAAPLYVLPPGHALGAIQQLMGAWSGLDRLAPVTPRQAAAVSLWLVATASFGLARCGQERLRGGIGLVLTFWLFVLFYTFTNPLMFEWYLPVLWVPWLLIVSLGLIPFAQHVVTALDRSQRHAPGWRTDVALGLALVLSAWAGAYRPIGAVVLLASRSPAVSLPNPTPERLRVVAYREAAEWLNARSHGPGYSVLAPEVGAFGYYFTGHVYDACGLVSPQALPFLPVPAAQRLNGTVAAISKDLARAVEADYVVTLPVFSTLSTDRDPWFRASYDRVQSIPTPAEIWASREVVIWSHKGAAASGTASRP